MTHTFSSPSPNIPRNLISKSIAKEFVPTASEDINNFKGLDRAISYKKFIPRIFSVDLKNLLQKNFIILLNTELRDDTIAFMAWEI